EGHCVNLKMLAVNGADLMELGFPAGPELGKILQSLLEDVLECPAHNTKEYLLKKAVSEKK
ncbi:MAG: polynucleotide adenylyltransferase, partial [Lachnospiraceae bacterium]|nr:polynucleotide adenylyltransferase [Lachnospiraceae bacterium]